MSVINEKDRKVIHEINPENGSGNLYLEKLLTSPNASKNLRTFAKATLECGASVGFHTHEGESEAYYILSGEAEYNDNGVLRNIKAGDVTFTPSGEGHGIKNIGKEPLVFLPLIIFD